MDGAADMDIDPDELKEDLKTAIYDLQWDLKSLGCDYSGVVSDFLQATRKLAPAEPIPKLANRTHAKLLPVSKINRGI